MFQHIHNVAANEIPDKNDFLGGMDAYFYNVKDVVVEEGSGSPQLVFSVLLVPRGMPEKAVARELKFCKLRELTVTVNGHTYDANSEARTNMLSVLATMTEGDTVEWKLHDNTWLTVSYEELADVLASATATSAALRS